MWDYQRLIKNIKINRKQLTHYANRYHSTKIKVSLVVRIFKYTTLYNYLKKRRFRKK